MGYFPKKHIKSSGYAYPMNLKDDKPIVFIASNSLFSIPQTLAFLFVLLTLVFSTTTMKAQPGKSWGHCYLDESAGCTRCVESGELTRKVSSYSPYDSIPWCETTVVYKTKTCNCNGKTTVFIDINFIYADLVGCCDLVKYLHPPGPYTGCSYDSTTAYNNPVDPEHFQKFLDQEYKALMDSLFFQMQLNYICPNTMKFKYLYESACTHECEYEIQPQGSTHGPTSMMFINLACDTANVCCDRTVEYCRDINGVIQKTETGDFQPHVCEGVIPPPAPYIPPFQIDGVWYTATLRNPQNIECIAPCTIP